MRIILQIRVSVHQHAETLVLLFSPKCCNRRLLFSPGGHSRNMFQQQCFRLQLLIPMFQIRYRQICLSFQDKAFPQSRFLFFTLEDHFVSIVLCSQIASSYLISLLLPRKVPVSVLYFGKSFRVHSLMLSNRTQSSDTC